MATAAELLVILKAKDELGPVLNNTAKELKNTAKELDEFSGNTAKVAGSIATIGTAAVVGGVVALGAGLGVAVKSAADFEKQMSGVKAVSGATTEEMVSLSAQALQLGKDTSFSATEAARGIEELAKAGVSVTDILGGGAAASLNLAAAGEVDVAEAAIITSNALNAFGLSGAEATMVADRLAGASVASAADVHQLGLGMAQVSAVANTMGLSFEDSNTALALMAQHGIKGSDAGTSLKTALMNLQPVSNKQNDLFRDLGIMSFNLEAGLAGVRKMGVEPLTEDSAGLNQALRDILGLGNDTAKWTGDQVKAFEKLQMSTGALSNQFFDQEGKVKDLAGIAGVLRTALGGMTRAQQLATLETIGGNDAVRAFAVLLDEGPEGVQKMTGAIAGFSAADVAATRLDNLEGSIEKMKGSLATAAIAIGTAFLPVLRQVVDAFTSFVNDNMPAIEAFAASLATAFTDAMPSIIAFFQALIDNRETIGFVVAALAGFVIILTVASWVATLVTVLAFLISPIGLIVVAIALLAAAWVSNWGDIQGKTAAVVSWIQGVPKMLEDAWKAIQSGWQSLTTSASSVWTTITTTISTAVTAIVTAASGVIAKIQAAWTVGWTAITGFLRTAMTVIGLIFTIALGFWYAQFVERWAQIFLLTQTAWNAISAWFMAWWTPLIAFVTTQLTALGLVLTTAWTAISTAIVTAWTAISTWFQTVFWAPLVAFFTATLLAVQTLLTTAWAIISAAVITAWTAISTWFMQTFWNPLVAFITTTVGTIQSNLATAWEAIKAKAIEIWDALKAAILERWNQMKSDADTVTGELSASVQSTFEDLASKAKSWATEMLGNFFEGLKEKGEQILDWVKNFVNSISEKMSSAGEEDSPSKMMFRHGANFGEGFRLGLSSKLDSIKATAGQIAGAVTGFGSATTAMAGSQRYFSSVGRPSTDNIRDYIAEAAAIRGMDPSIALRVAQSEGRFEPAVLGDFSGPPWYSGKSWWPFQLHYGGAGTPYAAWGGFAGMGNTFTAMTGWAPGDPAAWKDSVDYALDVARNEGWGKWYGAAASGIGNQQGIPRAMGGPVYPGQRYLVGERGPEMFTTSKAGRIIPNHAMGGITIQVNAPIYGVNDMEDVVIRALDRAGRRGRV